jgi:glycosyltransferase involved in cell wall biosynthesis
LHHGIDPEPVRAAAGDRAATRAALGIGPDTFLGVQVANFRREKGHDVMVETAKLLRDAGDDIKIVMVGQGPLMDGIRDAVRESDLGGVVTMLGFRDDVPALLGAADALVLSSDHEGLPVAMMEGFALGTPIISTRVGGIPEAVTDGVEGLLVPPRDPQALATALRRAAGDAGLRRTLAAGAAARSVDFDPRAATARIEAIYRSLLAG